MIGYYGIGIYNNKYKENIGTLWRSAYSFNANFIFTICKRYKYQSSDVNKTWKNIPLYHYIDFDIFYENMPKDCILLGIELTDMAININEFNHPKRAIYLLGSEDGGLPNRIVNRCHSVIVLPGKYCLNVSIAGSIVMFDRLVKSNNALPAKQRR